MPAKLESTTLLVVGLLLWVPALADEAIGVGDLKLAAASLTAESFLGKLEINGCNDLSVTSDLRCDFASNPIGPDGAMYTVAGGPTPTGALCFEGGTQPCTRSVLRRHRPEGDFQTLFYLDERMDSNGLDAHEGTLYDIYLDPTDCSLYVRLETYCLRANGDCTLEPFAFEVVRIRGLKGPKCTVR